MESISSKKKEAHRTDNMWLLTNPWEEFPELDWDLLLKDMSLEKCRDTLARFCLFAIEENGTINPEGPEKDRYKLAIDSYDNYRSIYNMFCTAGIDSNTVALSEEFVLYFGVTEGMRISSWRTFAFISIHKLC